MSWMSWHWEQRPEPHAIDPDWLAEQTPVRQALIRFNHAWRGWLRLPLRGHTLSFLLEDDLAMVFDRLPAWLAALAAPGGEADLLFASQGSELVLYAKQSGEDIVVSATRLDDNASPIGHPVAVPRTIFFADWRAFLLSFLEALATLEPALRRDEEWRRYRAMIAAVAEV
jgi:hypothetical protein